MLRPLRHSRAMVYSALAIFLWVGCVTPSAHADIVATETLLAETQQQQLRDRLLASLERQDMQQRLQAHGVSAEDAAARVAALSDEELQKVAQDFGDMPAGGDITLLLVIIILILLIR